MKENLKFLLICVVFWCIFYSFIALIEGFAHIIVAINRFASMQYGFSLIGWLLISISIVAIVYRVKSMIRA